MQIEKNVPIPGKSGAKHKYLWNEMDIGDSVLVPCGEWHPTIAQQRIAGAARAKFGPGNVVSRREGDAIRVWRKG